MLLQPRKISELMFTPIVMKREYQTASVWLRATSVRLKEVLKVCQDCHNLNLTAKLPVVTSPAVRFRLVPLTKRMLVRVGQVNRLTTASNPATDTPLLPSEQCSTHVHRVPRGKEDNEASHINDGSSPLSVFLLYFIEIITLLVVETHRYYHDYIALTMDPFLNLTLL